MRHTISVILPSYNRAQTLPRAIHSVLQQSYSNFTFIIVDDGSSDATEAIVAGYQDQRISYLHQQHTGVSAARNFGIRQADSTLIAFIDSDDQWLSDKLETQVNYLEKTKCRLVQTEEVWIRKGRQVNPGKVHLKQQGDIFEPSLHRCTITPSSLLIDKQLLYQCGLFDEQLPACEDYDLWLRITCQHTVGLIRQKLLIRYAGHHDQLSEKYTAMDRFRIYALHKLLVSRQCNSLQQTQTEAMLKHKAAIVLAGRYKRNANDKNLTALLHTLVLGHWEQIPVADCAQLLLNEANWIYPPPVQHTPGLGNHRHI